MIKEWETKQDPHILEIKVCYPFNCGQLGICGEHFLVKLHKELGFDSAYDNDWNNRRRRYMWMVI